MSIHSRLSLWLAGAAHRYPDDTRLGYAYVTRAWSLAPVGGVGAVHLHQIATKVLGRSPWSIARLRSISASVRRWQRSSAALPAPGRAARQVVGLVFSPKDLTRSRLALARRALAIIGLQSIDDASRGLNATIVSRRWLALRLHCTPTQAGRVIDELVACEVLVNMKLMRDQKTRTWQLRQLSKVERIAAELLWPVEADALAAFVVSGAQPVPGSVADIIASAASPIGGCTIRGAWAVALHDAARPDLQMARQIGRDLRGTQWLSKRKRQQVACQVEELYGWLAELGGPTKKAVAREWLAERQETGFVAWLAGLAETSGVQTAADAAAAADANERRARVRVADQLTGNRRTWRRPEEMAVEILRRIGDRPATLDEARVWLSKVADANAAVADRLTPSQRAALREAVHRVLVSADMDSERAAIAAGRATKVRREEWAAA